MVLLDLPYDVITNKLLVKMKHWPLIICQTSRYNPSRHTMSFQCRYDKQRRVSTGKSMNCILCIFFEFSESLALEIVV